MVGAVGPPCRPPARAPRCRRQREDREKDQGRDGQLSGFVCKKGPYVAKGIALIGAGGLVVAAVFTSDPSKATGIDGAIKTLGAQPFGRFLLILAGVGIGLYGLYAFVLARRAQM